MAVNGTESIQNGKLNKLNKVEFLSDHMPISFFIIVDVFMDFFSSDMFRLLLPSFVPKQLFYFVDYLFILLVFSKHIACILCLSSEITVFFKHK